VSYLYEPQGEYNRGRKKSTQQRAGGDRDERDERDERERKKI